MDLTTTGICIMTGGKSSRMGEDKASISLDGKITLFERACQQMSAFGYRYISVNKDQDYSYEGYETVRDEYDGIGPMGGIAGVLEKTPAEAVIFLACDMPFFTFEDACEILEHYDGKTTVPLADKRWQPLAALYTRDSLDIIKAAIERKDYKLRNVIERLDHTEFESMNPKAYINVNTREEFERFCLRSK